MRTPSNPESTPDSRLEARMATLERRVRRLSLLAAVTTLVAAGAVALWARREQGQGTVRAERLLLVDARGTTRAELSATSSDRSGIGLTVRDAQGHPRALLGVTEDGTPRLSFATSTGQSLAEISAYADAAPRLSLSNLEGNEFFSVSLLADGSAKLDLADQDGHPRAVLHAAEDGSPALQLYDRRGRSRAELSVSTTGKPSMILEGEDGQLFKAPADG